MIIGQNSLLNQYVPTFLIKDLRDGQTLVFDSVRRAFINAESSGSGGVDRLGELLDVSDSVDNPLSLQDGQALVYNSFTSLWENTFVDFDTLINKPTSADYSLVGLSDTADTPVASGILRWNSLGTEVEYVSDIPATQISGLADVATEGTLGSLDNVSPTADTLNNSSDVGKTLVWSGTNWIPGSAISSTRVVANLAARDALTPSLGLQAYVVDSDDGVGDYVNQWSLWIYTITGPSNGWTLLARQDSADSDSATLEYTFDSNSPASFTVGTLQTGGRITLITIEVTSAFDAPATIEIGYTVNNPLLPPPVPAGLMTIGETDLTHIGTYSTISDILFGTDTLSGDVDITANFIVNGATTGTAQIIVSYV